MNGISDWGIISDMSQQIWAALEPQYVGTYLIRGDWCPDFTRRTWVWGAISQVEHSMPLTPMMDWGGPVATSHCCWLASEAACHVIYSLTADWLWGLSIMQHFLLLLIGGGTGPRKWPSQPIHGKRRGWQPSCWQPIKWKPSPPHLPHPDELLQCLVTFVSSHPADFTDSVDFTGIVWILQAMLALIQSTKWVGPYPYDIRHKTTRGIFLEEMSQAHKKFYQRIRSGSLLITVKLEKLNRFSETTRRQRGTGNTRNKRHRKFRNNNNKEVWSNFTQPTYKNISNSVCFACTFQP